MNGDSSSSSGGGDANSKKLRKSRLANRVNSPVSIKIEDDSDDESLENKINSVSISTGDKIDKCVQTDNSTLMETLRRIVQERMHQYEAAALKDQCIDKQLSPLLEKLQRENEELRKYGLALKFQLDQKEKEKQSLKRRYGEIEAESGKSPLSRPPPYNASATTSLYTGVPNSNMFPPPRQTRPPPPLVQAQGNPSLPQQPPPPPPPLVQTQGNPPLAQPPPANNPLNQPRPPVQVVNNMRQISPAQVQPMMRHPFAPNERFMLLSNNNITMNGINTQVVSSNQAQGLRMTSMPSDINMLRPPGIDTNVRNMVATHQQQFLQRMPGMNPNLLRPAQQNNTVNPQLRPQLAQNTVRPMPPSGQNVPNLALPFSPLPKLTAAISTSNNAIVLTWDYHERMSDEKKDQFKVECYQLFAHQAKDARVAPPLDTKQWKKIGVVNALPLPMACTLTQFASGSVYFFAVVAVDIHGREGEMSNPCVIRLDVNQR